MSTLVHTARRASVPLVVTLGVLLSGAGFANATTAVAPDVSAVTDGFDSMKTLIATTLAVALVGIILAGLAITVGVKWLRKGANKA